MQKNRELASAIDRTPQKCKAILKEHYGSQFQGLIVYGSYARNQATDLSDLDLLVLLNQPFDYFQELRNITELLYPLQLESEYLISAKPADVNDYYNGALQLYRNVLREGVNV
jgi:predicted nucleotidyltransferase